MFPPPDERDPRDRDQRRRPLRRHQLWSAILFPIRSPRAYDVTNLTVSPFLSALSFHHPSIHLSIDRSVHPCVHMSPHLCLFIGPFSHLAFHLSFHIFLFIYSSVCLTISCLFNASIHLFISYGNNEHLLILKCHAPC